jgi:hypothetical protein
MFELKIYSLVLISARRARDPAAEDWRSCSLALSRSSLVFTPFQFQSRPADHEETNRVISSKRKLNWNEKEGKEKKRKRKNKKTQKGLEIKETLAFERDPITSQLIFDCWTRDFFLFFSSKERRKKESKKKKKRWRKIDIKGNFSKHSTVRVLGEGQKKKRDD